MAKSGFATIIGRPNVGKSTLMNTLIGQKIAITSYKPQTTRTQIRTIYTEERGQVVFLDTPGMFGIASAQTGRFEDPLNEYMYRAAESTMKEVDLILWLVEPKVPLTDEDKALMKVVASASSKTPVILVMTKVDSFKKEKILPAIAVYAEEWKTLTGSELSDIIPVSSRNKSGMEELRRVIFEKLPEGEPFFDEEMVTTETERDIAEEMIREKLLRLLQEEVPHGAAVQITRMKYRKSANGDPICDIDADIICERESHKGIIIGAKGGMLKKIGSAARTDIENMIQTRVNLKLWVKVRNNWKENEAMVRSYGYDKKKLK